MKNILLVHHWGSIGGAGISLLHIVRAIDKSRFKITVLCPDFPNSEMIRLLEKEKCEVIVSRTSPKIFAHYNGGIPNAISLSTIRNGIEILNDIKRINKYIKDIDPDIVAVNSMTLFWIGRLAKKMNKKTVCFHRETYQKGLFGTRSKIIKYGLSKWFDKIAFISWNDFYETGSTQASKKVIYDRVDVSSFNNKYEKKNAKELLGLDQNKKYVLYLGGLSALKGSDVIMEAMVYVDDLDVSLIFLENIKYIEKLSFKDSHRIQDKIKYIFQMGIKIKTLNIYSKNNLENKILFMNKTASPELYYQACDLVVFPSTKAHQSRPIYEAGIAKIPILITDFHQTKEFADNEITAITFENKNSNELAKKIVGITSGEIDVNTIVDNNYQKSMQNHDLNTLRVELNDFFEIE
ncbi:glycosyltransferase family 4 protein [Paenibacillus sp. MCAF9]|uniref:glycosyltransferase family 4 protein n=1 Tax=Paenibacillus sp. MCAF9 TaxID=3233046 RepID=UPI003F9D0535